MIPVVYLKQRACARVYTHIRSQIRACLRNASGRMCEKQSLAAAIEILSYRREQRQ